MKYSACYFRRVCTYRVKYSNSFIYFLVYGVIWASSQHNLFSGLPKKRDSNQSAQLHTLAKNFTYRMSTYDTFQNVNNKGADHDCTNAQAGLRLCGSETLEDRFSHVPYNLSKYNLQKYGCSIASRAVNLS